jgi:hypothetical protein
MLFRIVYCRIICSLFVVFSVTTVHGQHLLITGKVFDNRSEEPLAFASVGIGGKSFGTVTNVNGEFDFFIPPEFSSDSIVISHVGYESFRGRVESLVDRKNSFALNAKPVLLQEVVIREKNLTAKEIVSKAVKNLTLNYSTKPFCLEGFFREIEQENGKYVLLTEAAVDIYDRNFDGKRKNHLQEAVDVKEMRRSLRHGQVNNKDNIGHALADLIENNDVRYNRGMLDTASNVFTLDTITQYHDRLVYSVAMHRGTDTGELHIDTETFGILKISMERTSADPAKTFYDERMVGKDRKLRRNWFRFTVEFGLYDGTLYPRRMHESEMNEFYDAATEQLKITSIETLEFVANNIIPGKEDRAAKKLKYGMMIKPGEYHEAFWKNYNMLKLTPLDEKLIRDLEKDISLQKQFEQQK